MSILRAVEDLVAAVVAAVALLPCLLHAGRPRAPVPPLPSEPADPAVFIAEGRERLHAALTGPEVDR